MKLKSYREVLKMTEKKVKDALIPVRVKRARKQAELEMLKIEEDIANKEAELHEACTKEEIKFARIIEIQDKLGLLERRQKQYQQILDEIGVPEHPIKGVLKRKGKQLFLNYSLQIRDKLGGSDLH